MCTSSRSAAHPRCGRSGQNRALKPSFVPNHLRSLVGIQLMEDDMARAATTAAKKNERPSQPEGYTRLEGVTDAMHALPVKRADELMGCTENSPEEAELAALTDVIEAYESR